MHNIHTPRNGDRIRRGFLSDLVKGDRRWIRKIMQTVAFTKQLADPLLSTGCRPCCAPIGKCCAERVHLPRLKIWSQFINYDSSLVCLCYQTHDRSSGSDASDSMPLLSSPWPCTKDPTHRRLQFDHCEYGEGRAVEEDEPLAVQLREVHDQGSSCVCGRRQGATDSELSFSA